MPASHARRDRRESSARVSLVRGSSGAGPGAAMGMSAGGGREVPGTAREVDPTQATPTRCASTWRSATGSHPPRRAEMTRPSRSRTTIRPLLPGMKPIDSATRRPAMVRPFVPSAPTAPPGIERTTPSCPTSSRASDVARTSARSAREKVALTMHRTAKSRRPMPGMPDPPPTMVPAWRTRRATSTETAAPRTTQRNEVSGRTTAMTSGAGEGACIVLPHRPRCRDPERDVGRTDAGHR